MEYRRLGKSGLQVSALSFGSWITFGDQISRQKASKLMTIAYDQGVNFFDNAETYAQGKSEEVMGSILKEMQWERSSYLVSSKVFFGDGGTKPNQTGLSRKHIFEACNAALRRFQLEYLDLFYCHRPDKNTPIVETVWAMNHLIQQGKILYWGTSEWSAQEIMESHMVAEKYNLIGPTMEQPQHNMFYRERIESEYMQLFNTVGLGTTTWSPLASGTLTGKYIDESPKDSRMNIKQLQWLKERSLTPDRVSKIHELNELAKELDIPMAQLAIGWCLKNKNISSVILGATKEKQLTQNLGAIEITSKLTTEIMEKIEVILDNKPVLPMF